MEDIKVGSVVKGVVTGIESYGIFVKISDKLSGLIHISEISEKFVKDINNYVKMGETIYAEVKDLDENTNRVVLSIKGINYRINENSKVKESIRGFKPLKQHLPIWVEEKLKDLENDEI